jgi:hypothetical protein
VCVRFGDRKTAGQKMASFADGQISWMLIKEGYHYLNQIFYFNFALW